MTNKTPAKNTSKKMRAPQQLLYLQESELRQVVERFFFAYRAFTSGPDQILVDLGLGRAHHRLLYFVGRRPGLTVGELLSVLQITKQSLARAMKPLVEAGFIEQTKGERDARQRHLRLTPKGEALERQLFLRLKAFLVETFSACDDETIEGFRRLLDQMVPEQDRRHLGEG